jgi:fumarate hydratase class II
MKQVFAPATFTPGVLSSIRPEASSSSSSSSDADAIASLPSRMESDSFGSLSIPPKSLWGAQTQRSIQNFPIGGRESRMPMEVVYAQCLIKKCCAEYWAEEANGGKMAKDKADAIGKAADEVMAGMHDDQFPLVIYQTGSGTQTNMNVNEVLSNRAIMILGGEVGSKTPVRK